MNFIIMILWLNPENFFYYSQKISVLPYHACEDMNIPISCFRFPWRNKAGPEFSSFVFPGEKC